MQSLVFSDENQVHNEKISADFYRLLMMPSPLLTALQNPALYPHPVQGFRVLETHISWVLLTGEFAYKIKKPVDFGFLDFTKADDRRFYCEREVELNRRLSGDLYRRVVMIGGTPESPVLDGAGPPFEYAVQMREFPQSQLLDAVQSRGELTAACLDALAQRMAGFHADTPPAPAGHAQRHPAALFAPMQQNFVLIRPLLQDAEDLQQLARLEARTRQLYERLQPLLARRIADDRIRECHGDLHLGNIALIDGQPTPFDCIEFNDAFRLIDVASDTAFLVMDLESRGLPALAARFLNGWLEHSGDYDALTVMDFYKTYRALVRAKVNLLRLGQGPDALTRQHILAEYRRYAALAESYGVPRPRFLAMTCGVSAVGKSRVAMTLVESGGAVRLRSDVERKRLLGQQPPDLQGQLTQGIYDAGATAATYRRLRELARAILTAGYPVVLDATFLKRSQRAEAAAQAAELGVSWRIVDCEADEAVIEARLAQRQAEGSDPSDATLAVIRQQRADRDALDAGERAHAVTVRTDDAESVALAGGRLLAGLDG
jgi:aminoglycoside phosphotransferase family enzyme/predicted kinase